MRGHGVDESQPESFKFEVQLDTPGDEVEERCILERRHLREEPDEGSSDSQP